MSPIGSASCVGERTCVMGGESSAESEWSNKAPSSSEDGVKFSVVDVMCMDVEREMGSVTATLASRHMCHSTRTTIHPGPGQFMPRFVHTVPSPTCSLCSLDDGKVHTFLYILRTSLTKWELCLAYGQPTISTILYRHLRSLRISSLAYLFAFA